MPEIPFGGSQEFTYTPTLHHCPECGLPLTRVDLSDMLVCIDKHGPYFLI